MSDSMPIEAVNPLLKKGTQYASSEVGMQKNNHETPILQFARNDGGFSTGADSNSNAATGFCG